MNPTPDLITLGAAVDAAARDFANFAAPVLESARPVGEAFSVPADSMDEAMALLTRWRTAATEYGAARARVDGQPVPPAAVPRLPRRTRAEEKAADAGESAPGEAVGEGGAA